MNAIVRIIEIVSIGAVHSKQPIATPSCPYKPTGIACLGRVLSNYNCIEWGMCASEAYSRVLWEIKVLL